MGVVVMATPGGKGEIEMSQTGGIATTFQIHAGQEADVAALNVVPVRDTNESYGYGLNVDGDSWFRGGAAQKSYLVMITGDRDAAYAATGDSNDAWLRVSGNNYAANDSNFIIRGFNCAINQIAIHVLPAPQSASIKPPPLFLAAFNHFLTIGF